MLRKTKKGPVADRMPQKAREQYERTIVIARESIAIDNADAEKALFWEVYFKHLIRSDKNMARVPL